MNTTSFNYRLTAKTIVLGLCLAASGAYAQVSSINSAIIIPRVFNDVPSATGTYVNNYAADILLGEVGMSSTNGYANRDVWEFSNNGTTAYQFGNSDYFLATMSVRMIFNDNSIDNEAGFILNSSSLGQFQLIQNNPGAFIGQFGGMGFWNSGLTYTQGMTVTYTMRYFKASDGNNAIQYSANGILSPVAEFPAGTGIGAGSTLGGYMQIQTDAKNPANLNFTDFQNITIVGVPEPTTLALAGLGGLATLVALRRRS